MINKLSFKHESDNQLFTLSENIIEEEEEDDGVRHRRIRVTKKASIN